LRIAPPDWRESAKCKDGDNSLFFDPRREEEAKAFCVGCPVMAECLSAARQGNEPGVWGGTTEAERKQRVRAKTQSTMRGRRGRPLTTHEERCLKALSGPEQREEAIRLSVAGVTQRSIASVLGVDQSAISKWVRKKQEAEIVV
jgi:WhiB family redox-sensing transcriptional regulator